MLNRMCGTLISCLCYNNTAAAVVTYGSLCCVLVFNRIISTQKNINNIFCGATNDNLWPLMCV